jgi:hypothetical protein
MNTDIDENDCIVVNTKGGEVGKRAVDEGGGWTRVTSQRAKGNSRASTSEPAAKAAKVFTTAGVVKVSKDAHW